MRAAEEARAVAAVRSLFAALDVGDFDGARLRLAPTVELDYVGLWGGAPRRLAAEDLVQGWRDAISGFDAVRHDLGAPRPAVGGSSALVVCPAEILHLLDDRDWRLTGVYRLGLVRASPWRVASIVFELERETGDRDLVDRARRRARARRRVTPDQA
ncbi:MAG: hypothetical protein ACK4Z5_10375 [Brevundimonas sp.]